MERSAKALKIGRYAESKAMYGDRRISGEVLLDSGRVWTLQTPARHYIAEKLIEGLLDALYSMVTRTYFDYRQILGLLDKVFYV